jgi:hypothetical protein
MGWDLKPKLDELSAHPERVDDLDRAWNLDGFEAVMRERGDLSDAAWALEQERWASRQMEGQVFDDLDAIRNAQNIQ